MSLFKDLIDELKDENLLEETIEEHLAKKVDEFAELEDHGSDSTNSDVVSDSETLEGDSIYELPSLSAENFTVVEVADSESEETLENVFQIIEEDSGERTEVYIQAPDKVFVPHEATPPKRSDPTIGDDLVDAHGAIAEPEIAFESEPELAAAAEPEVEADTEIQTERATAFESAPELLPVTESEVEPEAKAETGPETAVESEPGIEAAAEQEVDVENEEETEDEAAFESESETESYSKPEFPAGSAAQIDAEEDADANDVPLITKELYIQSLRDTVKSLQHVQHIISGVQREQMREKPITYDTVPVKQALHKFVEAVTRLESPENTPAEAVLHEEIGKWHAELLGQDRKTSVAHLRRYCEDTNPPLSNEAVASIARFYRNSPFNEDVRSKFDLVVTRLFSKGANGDKRQTTLHRDEIIVKIKELYAEWSSVSLYNDENEDSDIILAAFKFEDFVTEVNKVRSFDDLIKNGFFKRIKSFKEKLQENFFSPLLVAVAVECNVLIGNRYVDLILAERKKVSSRVSKKKTLKPSEKPSETISKLEDHGSLDDGTSGGVAKVLLEGNRKWFSAAGLAAIILMVALYTFGAFSNSSSEMAESAQPEDGAIVNLERSSFNSYIEEAKIKNGVFIGVTTPTWDKLTYQKKEEILKKIHLAGSDRGYTEVQLTNSSGTSVGIGTESGISVIE